MPPQVFTTGVGWGGKPKGCRGSHPERVSSFKEIASFRREYGLDLDLAGNRRAIHKRIVALIRAWRRGDPTARATMATFFMPMRPRDQREFEAREIYIEIVDEAIYRWARKHAPTTFADYYFDHAQGGFFYVGFTADQEALVAAFRRSVPRVPAARIKPFPFQPTHSYRELGEIEEAILDDESLWELMTSVERNERANVVRVGTVHTMKLRLLIAERFGTDAPVQIIFESPLIPLSWLSSSASHRYD